MNGNHGTHFLIETLLIDVTRLLGPMSKPTETVRQLEKSILSIQLQTQAHVFPYGNTFKVLQFQIPNWGDHGFSQMHWHQRLPGPTISHIQVRRRQKFSKLLVLICKTQGIDSRKLTITVWSAFSYTCSFWSHKWPRSPYTKCWELACPPTYLLPGLNVPSTTPTHPPPPALSGTPDNPELKEQNISYLNCKA